MLPPWCCKYEIFFIFVKRKIIIIIFKKYYLIVKLWFNKMYVYHTIVYYILIFKIVMIFIIQCVCLCDTHSLMFGVYLLIELIQLLTVIQWDFRLRENLIKTSWPWVLSRMNCEAQNKSILSDKCTLHSLQRLIWNFWKWIQNKHMT